MENKTTKEEKDLLEELESKLQKEKSIKDLSEELLISEFQVLGLIYKLKERGINIDQSDKEDTVYFVKNNHPDLTKENIYKIKEDINTHTKFAVISDIRFGSKCEQIQLLNDMYKKFILEGVKYVFITGNLLEGPYKGKTKLEFGKSLITDDAYGQADHLIEYFPKVEGITTLFITGENDHKFGKTMNVGEYIESSRNDMIYLGPKACTVMFNNVKIRLEQLKNGKAYTLAYPPQTYSRSLSTYENYDAIMLGGECAMQHFPYIRDTQIFSIPSVVDRTPKMNYDNKMNTMGTLIFDLEYDKLGKLKNLVPTMIPYKEPSRENYTKIKPLNLTKSSEGELINNSKNETKLTGYAAKLDVFYKSLKKEEEFTSILTRFGFKDTELMGLIDYLKSQGKDIELKEIDGKLIVRKTITKKKDKEIKPRMEDLYCKEVLVVSDTHYGSIYSQPSMVNTACYEAYNRGIDTFLHVGDIVDGDYSRIRPIHNFEVFDDAKGTRQIDYVIDTLPKYTGCKWKVIQGSHDQTHLFNYGLEVGKELEKHRNDIEYLGQDRAVFNLDEKRNICKIEMFHPGGGSSRILSTKPQNGIDQLESCEKVDLSLRGHYHKVYYMYYRGEHVLLCPCNVDQSSFMMKNELPNLMGNYFLKIYYDSTGKIHYLIPEPMIFTKNDVVENDWKNPKKFIKSKLTKKR